MSHPALHAIARVRGLRGSEAGPKLVIKDGIDIIVARSGCSPLAWTRPDKPMGKDAFRPWLPTRPALDELLIPPAKLRGIFQKRIQQVKTAIGKAEYHGHPRYDPANNIAQTHLRPSRVLRKLLDSCGKGDDRLLDIRPANIEGRNPVAEPDDAFFDNPQHVELLASLRDRIQAPSDHVVRMARRVGNERLLRRLMLSHKNLNRVTTWLDAFPPEALEFLERNRFSERRWHLLNLWIRVPALRQLMDDQPVLAWIAASSWCFRKPVAWPHRSLRALAGKPRRKLMEWLEIRGGNGTLRLLGRIRCKDLKQPLIGPLSRILKNPDSIRWLQNLPGRSIHPDAIKILGQDGTITFAMLLAIHEHREVEGSAMNVFAYFRDTRRMINAMVNVDAQARLGRINTVPRLVELHDELTDRFNIFQANGKNPGSWSGKIPSPLAPLPSWLIPLDTCDAILEEGKSMRHCAASHVAWVANRAYYIYHVEHPAGRATLSIRQNPAAHNEWQIAELAGFANAAVPAEIRDDIRSWLINVQDLDPL